MICERKQNNFLDKIFFGGLGAERPPGDHLSVNFALLSEILVI